MSDVICEICWTASWQPCEEGAKDAVPDTTTGGWMQCGFCVLQEAYVALRRTVKKLRSLACTGYAYVNNPSEIEVWLDEIVSVADTVILEKP